MTRIHVRAIDSGETMELRGTEAGLHPLWSPNGDSIAFLAGQTLKRMDFATGSVRDLIGIGFGWQAAWSRNDEILVRAGGELSRIFGQGGAVTRIPHSSDATFPSFLRDSKRFLVRVSNDSVNSIQIQSLVSGKRTWVLDDVQSAPILAPTPRGKTYLFFLRDFDLFAQEFDEASGKVLVAPVVLVSRVGRVGEPAVRPAVGVSTSGILAYQKADAVTTTQLKWLERSGLPVRTLSPDVSVSRPRLSPDQSLVVGTRPSSRQHIWVLNLKRPSSQRLTWDDTPENFAVWSKDGSHIAFLRSKRGIYATAADGRGKPKLLTETQGNPTSWSRQYLMYTFPSPPNGKIHMLDVTTGKVIQVGSPNGNSSVGQFSPDGAYIAFCSDKSGRNEQCCFEPEQCCFRAGGASSLIQKDFSRQNKTVSMTE